MIPVLDQVPGPAADLPQRPSRSTVPAALVSSLPADRALPAPSRCLHCPTDVKGFRDLDDHLRWHCQALGRGQAAS